MIRASIVLGLAVLMTAVCADKPCGDWAYYSQCDPKWANKELGTGSHTICAAGCAMSSVAMFLTTKGETIDKTHPTPETLNKWLTGHDGYVNGDNIVWNSVAKLGPWSLAHFVPTMDAATVREHVSHCKPVIVNVRDGSHWVLVVGWNKDNLDEFYVNDPGFNDKSYDHSGMSYFVVYSNDSSVASPPGSPSSAPVLLPVEQQQQQHPVSPFDFGSPDTGVYGVDVSQPTSEDAFRCMAKEHAVSEVTIRAYMETGKPDPALLGTYKAAKNAGLKVGVYHFPDTHQDAYDQAKASVQHLKANGIDFDMFWLDIENSDWGSNHTHNNYFIEKLRNGAENHGAKVGVYTSEWSWEPITGNSDHFGDLPLWYPHYQQPPDKSFSDFKAFGGWKTPYMKQYKGNVALCGANVDVSWRP